MAPKVAIIGAGPLGLMALKNFREEGFDATSYEGRGWVGGLWNYSEDEAISTGEFTMFNSSKYRSSISDFPFPEDADDYPSWQQMHAYMNSYADRFGLRKHINLNSYISNVTRKNGKWILEVTPKDGPKRQDAYDKLLVATGAFTQPKLPKFKGMEKFKGRAMHAMKFHLSQGYKDRNVLVVGLHATAQDVVVALKKQAKHVYLSHRSGIVLLPRYGPDGATLDSGMGLNFTFFMVFALKWFPSAFNWLLNTMVGILSDKSFPGQKTWGFLPRPKVEVAPPLIADELYPLMKSGFAEPVREVVEVLGPKSFRLKDGTVLDDVDDVVFCTGYNVATPFIPAEWNPYPVEGDAPYLYRNIFSLHSDPTVRDSLAFCGHGGIPFPGFVQFEMQALAIAQVWKGASPLPPFQEQLEWHKQHMAWRRDIIRNSGTHDQIFSVFINFPDQFEWLDRAAGTGLLSHFGWLHPKAWSFWWRDAELYRLCKKGMFSPAIWRLFEGDKRKAWPGARQQIFKDNAMVDELKAKKAEKVKREKEAEKESQKAK